MEFLSSMPIQELPSENLVQFSALPMEDLFGGTNQTGLLQRTRLIGFMQFLAPIPAWV
jgi:hypothetical protein